LLAIIAVPEDVLRDVAADISAEAVGRRVLRAGSGEKGQKGAGHKPRTIARTF
jgi:hypothetical protein